jgi:chromosome segregation ATPase
MSRVKGPSLSGIVLLMLLGCVLFSNSKALTTPANQSPQNDNVQPMQALLNEVHQLRLAIQRSNLNTYHAQVTLERLRLQQQRVDRLSEKLEEARAKLSEIRSNQVKLPEEIKRVEELLGKEPDPINRGFKRRELESVLQTVKAELENLAQKESQAREQEAHLNGQLQTEQAKLNEVNERLDALQKEVDDLGRWPELILIGFHDDAFRRDGLNSRGLE